jgi:hypothetical protein
VLTIYQRPKQDIFLDIDQEIEAEVNPEGIPEGIPEKISEAFDKTQLRKMKLTPGAYPTGW